MRGHPELISFFAASLVLPVFLIAQEPRPSTHGTQTGVLTAAPEISPRLTPSEIETYKSAPTLIDWSQGEIQHCAYLHGLEPAGSQAELPGILERVGQTCDRLFDDFLNVTCDEEVVSRGVRAYSRVGRDFHYIVIRRPIGDLQAFEEYRTDLQGSPLSAASFWDFSMITSGFASDWLYFSPADQHGNRYRYLGIQTIRNRECHVVGFTQDPDRARYFSKFDGQGKRFSLLVQGLAWIDPQTFELLRITTWLLAPRRDFGLSSQTSTVDFYPVRPSGTEKELWLPREVRVEILYRGIRTRNIHQYSNYKLFRVESYIKP